jgi:EAL domain-containing protein (putative c-di-GMP-specific phosphodiesterase class I)
VGDLDVVFQPIVDMQTGATFAYEALTRCKWPEFKNPLVLFQQAEAERACGPLGRKIREVAFERCPDAPLFVNLHPHELSDGGWFGPMIRCSFTTAPSISRSPSRRPSTTLDCALAS